MNEWFVKFPTFLYKEDVKELAIRHKLAVIDDRYQGNRPQCQNPPKLTLKRKKKVQEIATPTTQTTEAE